MRVQWKQIGAVTSVVAIVGGLLWFGPHLRVSLREGADRPLTAADQLGVNWATNNKTPNGGSGSQGNGLDMEWATNNKTPNGGSNSQGNGLDMEWATNTKTPNGSTGGSSGLNIDWAGKSALGEQDIRLSYQKAFGRDPTPAELTRELDRQSWDQKVRSLPDLVEAHRAYLKSSEGRQEFEATMARALKAVPGHRNVIAQFGLIYADMVRRLTIHASYQTAFGRAPAEAEERQWPEDLPGMDTLIQTHRNSIRQDSALRKAIIELAYRNTWKRLPIPAEFQRWDPDLQTSGKTYAELAAAIAGASDPAMPEPPVVLRHDSRMGTSHNRQFSTTLFFRQSGDRVERFRILRQNPETREWKEVGTQPAGGAGQEISFVDAYQRDRAIYKVCAVNQQGEVCSQPYATTDRPNQVRISAAKADSPTLIGIHWYRVGDDVTEMAVKRQKADGGWEEVFREKAKHDTYHRYFDTVKPATKGIYEVCAYNAHGETCTPWLIIEPPLPVAAVPADFKVTAQNQTDWLITWRPQNKDMVRLERWNLHTRQWDLLSLMRNGETQYLQRELIGDPFYGYRVCSDTGYNEACTPSITVGKQFDHPTNFTSLDYGVYWFRCGTCRGSTKGSDNGTQSDGVKAVPGLSKEYFDPTRPTVIYVHGWERESVKQFARESMKSPTDDLSMMEHWQKAGWNVGIFYWNAFSDDDWGAEPRFSEAKIDHGDITWSISDGRGGSNFAPTRVKDPASVLFTGSIIEAMKDFKGPELRIVGHSLGTQMAVMATYYISRSDHAHLTPKRVALLDPWISSKTRAEGLGGLIDQVKRSHGTVYEYYQTSVISQEHGEYGERAVTVRVHPMYAPAWEPGKSHAAAIHWYFNSMGFAWNTPSARMSLEQLRPLMDCDCRFNQDGGQDTKPVADDTFSRHKKIKPNPVRIR